MMWYRLTEDKRVVPVQNIIEYLQAVGIQSTWQRVEETFLDDGKIRISTVFLGLDHGYRPDQDEPVCFETMIFGLLNAEGNDDQEYQTRCSTYEHALLMHQTAINYVKTYLLLPTLVNIESFTCPKCGATSYNSHDITNQFCSNCKAFITDPS